jgi:hypothetical protein
VRDIRDQVEQRVTELISEHLDAIRADRTSHQLRLQRLLPDLVDEFAGVRSGRRDPRLRRRDPRRLRRRPSALVPDDDLPPPHARMSGGRAL